MNFGPIKTGKFIASLFVLIGAIVFVIAVYCARTSADFIAHAIKAQGTVLVPMTDTQYGRFSFVDQQNERHEFSPREQQSPPPFSTGETVGVLYLPDDPGTARLDRFFSLWGATCILAGLGTTFSGIGGALLFLLLSGTREHTSLKQTGIALEAKTYVVRQVPINVNGKYLYRIVSTWNAPRSGKTYQFKSRMLDFDPSRLLGGQPVKIYYERGNPRKHYMDVSFLVGAPGLNSRQVNPATADQRRA